MTEDNKSIENVEEFVNAEPTMEEVIKLSEQFAKIGNFNHMLFIKALFVYERNIEDEEILDDMVDAYYKHNISLLNDLIVEKSWV